jgi:ABC-2 type transporter
MGIVVGTVFFQSTGVSSNVFSILFQSVLYQCLGAMVLIVKAFPARSIFYKQQDANFFPTWAYVLGRSLSTVPVAMIDAIGYVGCLSGPRKGAESRLTPLRFMKVRFHDLLANGSRIQ